MIWKFEMSRGFCLAECQERDLAEVLYINRLPIHEIYNNFI
jgi:hypothetical protein